MLLTLTTTHSPATDLGYLLHKNPARAQSFDLSFGQAHVFYPEASDERCTAALLLDVDPVGLVRNGGAGGRGSAGAVRQRSAVRGLVVPQRRDRAGVRHALAGTSKERPELARRRSRWSARLRVLPCRGGEALLRRLFEPLGYAVDADASSAGRAVPRVGREGRTPRSSCRGRRCRCTTC